MLLEQLKDCQKWWGWFKNKVREHLEIKNENINRNATDGLYSRIYGGEHWPREITQNAAQKENGHELSKH